MRVMLRMVAERMILYESLRMSMKRSMFLGWLGDEDFGLGMVCFVIAICWLIWLWVYKECVV